MSLLAKAKKEGQTQHITPQSAGWKYIGFDVWMLKKGQTVTLESGDRELCLVLVAGLASVKTTQADFPNLGQRMSPFERTPPYSKLQPFQMCISKKQLKPIIKHRECLNCFAR